MQATETKVEGQHLVQPTETLGEGRKEGQAGTWCSQQRLRCWERDSRLALGAEPMVQVEGFAGCKRRFSCCYEGILGVV